MDQDEHEDGVEKRVSSLRERGGHFLDTCQLQSAYRVYSELARVGKSEQRLIPYLHGVFHQMDIALSLMEPVRTREFALELIAYLESEEHARKFQPDFPDHEYEHTVAWMTACAYENLAEATGRTDGYNSEGMHGCITDGIDVCRRTGKLACVRCFREYATEVYTAADDLQMALHHSRSIAGHQGPWSNRGDRRWLGVKNEAWLLLLTGQVEAAIEALNRSLPLSQEEEVGIQAQARLEVLSDLEQALILAGQLDAGQPSPAHRCVTEADPSKTLPKGEWPWLDARQAMTDALRACVRGDHAEAQKILTNWDRWLTERKHLSDWFEVRLRLIAVHRLAGQNDRAEALGKQLGERAKEARDWLTLRRLGRLLDDNETASPLAVLGPLAVGPYASQARRVATDSPPVSPPPPAGEPPADMEPESPPLDGLILGLVEQLDGAREDEDVRKAMLHTLLCVEPDRATHPFDASRLIQLTYNLLGDGERGETVWAWAQAVAAPHPREAGVLSVLAVLGDRLRGSSEKLAATIGKERVVELFRASLDLDPFNVRNHARAGAFHLHDENLGEAERCLARGFRLERSNSFLALKLAEVYRRTERPRDALAVLDMALREDCDDATVAWEAAIIAFNLEQYDSLLTYLDVHEGMSPGQPWVYYYKTLGLLEQGRPREALEAVAVEEERSPDRPWPQHVLRACAHSALDEPEPFRRHLDAAVATRLAEVDYLTVSGLASLFERLWKAADKLPPDDSSRVRLTELLLTSGMAPEDLFEEVRDRGETAEGINFYRCTVRQPLDENWAGSPGCLHGQEGWSEYLTLWGVLAKDEGDAARRVLEWQAKCHPLPAEVVDAETNDEGFTDKPGVVWQGARWVPREEGETVD